jgi:hypothetical protein
MQSRIGVKWVKNKQESWYCELVLRRVTNFPAEIRWHIQQFLYDCVCLLDEPFHSLGVTWSSLQLAVYRSTLTGPRINTIQMPEFHGATTVIAGMAISFALLGFQAVIVAKDLHATRKCMAKVRLMYAQYFSSRESDPIRLVRCNPETITLQNGGLVRCVPCTSAARLMTSSRFPKMDIVFIDNARFEAFAETCPAQVQVFQIVSTPRPAPTLEFISY